MPIFLTDNEKRDIIKYIEAGKPLPDKYRFLLFDEKREVELVWNGKTNEVTNAVLPFQVIEHVDEPRSETEMKMQGELFDFSGRQVSGWTNKLIWGDNKLILSSLKNGALRDEIEEQGGIKLIYIDPPFDVGADFSMNIEIGDEQLTKQPTVLEELAYRDTWGKGADSFISMIYERLSLMRDLLADDGSIYVHCDYRLTHYLRNVLDEVFGKDLFLNEVIWQGAVGDTSAKNTKYIKSHDTILVYTKSTNWIWNDVFQEYSEASNNLYKHIDEKGRYRLAPVDNPGGRGYTYSFGKGEKLPSNGYRMPKETALEWLESGILIIENGKVPQKKLYMNESGVRCKDVWNDISSSVSKEYPTQKPEALLERIILASSNEDDLIADFFAGSGTTLAVAEKLGRKWIGSDLGRFSIHTTRKRMIGVQRELKKAGKDFRAFEILNIGKYEREKFLGVNENLREEEKRLQRENKEKDFIKLILSAYKAEPVDSFNVFVGKKRDRLVAVGQIDTPVTSDFLVFYNQDNTGEVEEKLQSGGSKIVIENGQVIKISKDKQTDIIEREVLTKKWTDWIDYWSVDFAFESKKEIVRVVDEKTGEEKEEWTGSYIFENEWQSFRTKKDRTLELTSAFKDAQKGKMKIAIKVIDIFGNDTTKVIEVN